MEPYKKRKPEIVKAANKRHQRKKRLRKYGLTPTAFDVLKMHQNGLCAICKEDKLLCVDHCHTTGYVRGLLCHKCNLLVGHLERMPELVNVALDYIENRKDFIATYIGCNATLTDETIL